MMFKPIFNYTSEIPDNVKSVVESDFIDARNEAIELLNPHYEEWNSEYGDVEDLDHYYKFIQQKQGEVLKEFNNNSKHLIRLFSSDEADIIGKFKYRGEVVGMDMELMPYGES